MLTKHLSRSTLCSDLRSLSVKKALKNSFSCYILISLSIIIGLLHPNKLKAQCQNTPTLSFHSPVLISGTSNQTGAVYRFANVLTGVDCHVTITARVGGATLSNIDDSTTGYYEAFQPRISAAFNGTSYIDWFFAFKKSGTFTDTSIACMSVTGIDVDGDNSRLREFIEAETPGSISVDPNTDLQVSFDGVRSRAVSNLTNVANIDTNNRRSMFQMNFANLSSLVYRNGAITTGSSQVRQTSIYFKKFFQSFALLSAQPVSLVAKREENFTQIKWSVPADENVKEYALQKSDDLRKWKDIKLVRADQMSRTYSFNDYDKKTGAVYYRLKQLHHSGVETYSKVIEINLGISQNSTVIHNSIFTSGVRLRITAQQNDEYTFYIFNSTGTRVKQQNLSIAPGLNMSDIDLTSALTKGIYLLEIRNRIGQQIYQGRLMKI
jgi:hypothetical protein